MSVDTLSSTVRVRIVRPRAAAGFVPLWKDGFETWHIFVFLVGLIGGNYYLVTSGCGPPA